jgi:hypothetical protein
MATRLLKSSRSLISKSSVSGRDQWPIYVNGTLHGDFLFVNM